MKNINECIEVYKKTNAEIEQTHREQEEKRVTELEAQVVAILESEKLIYDKVEGNRVFVPWKDGVAELHIRPWRRDEGGFSVLGCHCPKCGLPVWTTEYQLSPYNLGLMFSEEMDEKNSHLQWYSHNRDCIYPRVEKQESVAEKSTGQKLLDALSAYMAEQNGYGE